MPVSDWQMEYNKLKSDYDALKAEYEASRKLTYEQFRFFAAASALIGWSTRTQLSERSMAGEAVNYGDALLYVLGIKKP
jgi:hypothetical protein